VLKHHLLASSPPNLLYHALEINPQTTHPNAMGSENQQYAVDDEIATFFTKTPVTREACDSLAKELVGSDRIIPVAVQGTCSYTVYAGSDHIVQFRLKSLELKGHTAALARRIFGTLVPDVSFSQQLGDESIAGQEPLLVYVMTRIQGISRLDFVLAHGFPENSLVNKVRRKTLIRDVARYVVRFFLYRSLP
jgi:hypothetical protein